MVPQPGAWGLFAASALSGAVLTAGWTALARRRGIEDAPGQRRLHAAPTPRGGGIAIACVLLLAMLAWPPAGLGPGAGLLPWWGLVGGLALFTLVGALDDLRPMPVLAKFGGQWIAGAVLAWSLLLGSPDGFGWLAYGIVLVGTVYFVNIWNFMDGSNGLVAVQSLLLSLALALWPGQGADLRLMGLVLAGACVGFLPFNLPLARVFLGDAGSHLLGAAVFALLVLSWRRGVIGLPAALLLPSAMLADSGLTLLRRALAGRPIWRAHREHLYQYAVRSGYSHLTVCLAYAAWTLLFIAVSLICDSFRSSLVIWVSFTLCFVSAPALDYWLRRRWLSPGTRRGAEQ